MLAPWLDQPGAAELVAIATEAAGLDVARLGTKAGADELRSTDVAQPGVLTALVWRELPGVELCPLTTPDSLARARELVAHYRRA